MQSINELFPDEITKITNSLLPPHFVGNVGSIRRTQDSVKRVLDMLGEMSAQEQGLNRIITTAEKLRTADGHILYVLKVPQSNRRTQDSVKRVLDMLGEMSAQEQGLNRIITTAEKLRTADGHILYVLKDPQSNRKYLDVSQHGVVYHQLWNQRDTLATTPGEDPDADNRILSYDVLWKWDSDEFKGISNVIITKSLPQSD